MNGRNAWTGESLGRVVGGSRTTKDGRLAAMARTVTMRDDETGIELQVVIAAPDGGKPVVQSVSLAAINGQGVRPDDLLALEAFGLRLPDRSQASRSTRRPPADPRPIDPAPATPPAKAPTKSAKSAKPKAKPVRVPTPPDEVYLLDWRRFNGNSKMLADHYSVSRDRVWKWTHDMRKRGVIPPASQTTGEPERGQKT